MLESFIFILAVGIVIIGIITVVYTYIGSKTSNFPVRNKLAIRIGGIIMILAGLLMLFG